MTEGATHSNDDAAGDDAVTGDELGVCVGETVELAIGGERGDFAVAAVHGDHVRLQPVTPHDAGIVPPHPEPAVLAAPGRSSHPGQRGLTMTNASRTDVRFAPVQASRLERRHRAARVPVVVPVKVAPRGTTGDAAYGETVNISATGLLAAMDGPVPAFEHGLLTLRLPEEIVRIRVRQVRADRLGVAFAFSTDELEPRFALMRFLLAR